MLLFLSQALLTQETLGLVGLLRRKWGATLLISHFLRAIGMPRTPNARCLAQMAKRESLPISVGCFAKRLKKGDVSSSRPTIAMVTCGRWRVDKAIEIPSSILPVVDSARRTAGAQKKPPYLTTRRPVAPWSVACEFFFLLRKVSQARTGYTARILYDGLHLSSACLHYFNTRRSIVAKRVLGLDLGPNSIGWAIVEDDQDHPERSRLIDAGVRVFPEGVDNFDTGKEKSRNETRRIARGMRRQILRRVRRQRMLRRLLVDIHLWPAGDVEQAEILKLDPYNLRSLALQQKLAPYEIGRIFLHLSQRRGFLSNRKKDRGDAEVRGMLAEINENEQERISGGYETLGAWLASKVPQNGKSARAYHTERKENSHIRRRHLARKQYEEEFEAIWKAQAKHYPNLLTDQLKYGTQGRREYPCKPRPITRNESLLESFGVHGLLFFQRPMYWPKSVVGLCELEPKQKRCQQSDRRYQRFRLLQEVNNLRYADSTAGTETSLSLEERTLLLAKLSSRKEMTFDQIRNSLGFLESVRFNLERGNRSKIQGVPIDSLFAARDMFGNHWYERTEEQRTEIVAALLDNERDDNSIIQRAIAKWAMTASQAEKMLEVDLKPGYGSLSLVAIERLLPHLEKGLPYMAEDGTNSALHAAGYLRRDQLQRRIFDKLPDPQRMNPAECPIGDIPNPVVKRTLTEVRRLVNAIIREYGKPDAVHIEMAREVQQGKQKRSDYTKMTRARELEREQAAERLREHNVRITRDNILKYLLWEQQGNECIYSGRPISVAQLFGDGGGVEVDHILPRARTLDDSQANKVVCLRDANASKGNQTPYEWLAGSEPDRYEQLCQRAGGLLRAGKMPYAKYRRFIQKELDLDKFIARQLTDTGYITRATAEYLRCLFNQPHDVLGLKGQLTAELRWHWGLDTILQELPDSPGWQEAEAGRLRVGEKNRADHRHHAIDAVVLALTNRSRLHRLADIFRRGGARQHGEILLDPWPTFREDVSQRVAAVNVSHRVERKVCGALHEDTFYGPTNTAGEWVVRKPVVDLSAYEIEKIRDETIREIVMGACRANGIEFGRGKKPEGKKIKQALSNITMPSGVPIKKVRIVKPEKTIRALRCDGSQDQAYVKPGSTHHLCIFEWEENGRTKRETVFVTRLEAIERIKRQKKELEKLVSQWKEVGVSPTELQLRKRKAMSDIAKEFPIIKSNPIPNSEIPTNAHFVMSLSRGELVLANWRGGQHLLSYKTAASTQGQIYFCHHTDARRSSDQKDFVATANTLNARKVTVDLLGRVRWASD